MTRHPNFIIIDPTVFIVVIALSSATNFNLHIYIFLIEMEAVDTVK